MLEELRGRGGEEGTWRKEEEERRNGGRGEDREK